MADLVHMRLDGDPPKEGRVRPHAVAGLVNKGWVVVEGDQTPESSDEDDEPEITISFLDTEE